MKNILIIGANGQLGKALRARYPDATAVDRDDFDMTDWNMLSGYDWSKVDTIINAAGYTNVDGAEMAEGREAAWKINSSSPGYLSRLAGQHNLALVHISTEYVFDGTKDNHKEDEPFTPLGVYAQSKAAGDIAVSVAPKHYILRSSWLVGDGANFVRTMINLAEKNISPKVVSDQIGRLTFTKTVVDVIDHILTTKASYGTYNVSNDGEPVSWAEVARAVYKQLGRDDLTVTDITSIEYFADKPAAAPRPLLSTLDLTKIKQAGYTPRDWREDLREYIRKETSK